MQAIGLCGMMVSTTSEWKDGAVAVDCPTREGVNPKSKTTQHSRGIVYSNAKYSFISTKTCCLTLKRWKKSAKMSDFCGIVGGGWVCSLRLEKCRKNGNF